MVHPQPDKSIREILRRGVVIPACPLALDSERRFDERCQRALLRYYAAAGAGGVAVGVHTTQFEIREPRIGLFNPVLKLARDTLREESERLGRPIVTVAGICGPTSQAVAEAQFAASLGYDVGMVSLAALQQATDDELIDHCRAIGDAISIMGFYLQPAVGGRLLSFDFWRRFVEIPNVVAIKIAPFNRYQTLDVVRAVAAAGAEDRVALYTGNDDNIVADLLTPFTLNTDRGPKTLRIVGGLLGQWAVWTRAAVELLDRIHRAAEADDGETKRLLEIGVALTDANAAIFDAANGFAGCIPGIHEVLRQQGLLETFHCLDPTATLSPGQREAIDRVRRDYPFLTDDAFVRSNLDTWLG